MSEQSLPTSPTPLAFFDPESSCWRTSQGSLLSAAPESLERLPAWGTTSGGVLYELQTPERLTAVRDGSASLPTPAARDYKDVGENTDYEKIAAKSKLAGVAHLLPTPTSQAAKHGATPDIHANGYGSNLWDLPHLLPTPTARDFRDRGPHAGFTTREKCQSAVDRGFAHLPRVAALLPTPTSVESKVFGPNVDWEKRLSNHAIHIASVLMVKPWLDGNESSDDQLLTQLTIEGCDPDSSSG